MYSHSQIQPVMSLSPSSNSKIRKCILKLETVDTWHQAFYVCSMYLILMIQCTMKISPLFFNITHWYKYRNIKIGSAESKMSQFCTSHWRNAKLPFEFPKKRLDHLMHSLSPKQSSKSFKGIIELFCFIFIPKSFAI